MEKKQFPEKGFRPYSRPLQIESNQQIRKIAKSRKWKGKGSKADPFIIESTEIIFRYIQFTYINLYVVIKNTEIIGLELNRCQNFLIINCKVNNLNLSACSHIKITKSILYGTTKLKNCNLSTMKNSTVYYLILQQCFNNSIQGCKIPRIKNKLSRANQFSNNELSEENKEKLTHFLSSYYLSFVIFSIIYLGFFVYLTILITQILPEETLFMLFVPLFFIALILSPLIKFLKKIVFAREKEPNSFL